MAFPEGFEPSTDSLEGCQYLTCSSLWQFAHNGIHLSDSSLNFLSEKVLNSAGVFGDIPDSNRGKNRATIYFRRPTRIHATEAMYGFEP